MKKKNKKKVKKKTLKKKKIRANSKRNGQAKSMDLQKIIGFKFQTLSKVYKNFTNKRKKEHSVRKRKNTQGRIFD